ncbi:MAG: multiheme c-type cytochrome [Vicinamibacterales bacterium]
MTRYAWLLTLALAVLLGTIATRAQFETPNRAFHGNTNFPLTGRHQTVACESCHLKGVFKGTPTACYDCHWVRRQDDKFRTELGTQCETCHRTISWAAVRWDHGAMTSMPLSGAHRTLGCESCHTNNRFETASVSCISCHQDEYAATKSPNHASAGFPTACEACHKPSDVSFSQARFDHNASFPLTGQHASIACATCHRNNVFKGTSSQCASCHLSDFQQAQNPNHVAAGFPTTCETCHRPSQPTWQGTPGSSFSHATFPLTGQHVPVTCVACHRNNVFQGTPRDCVGCHRTEYDRTATPNHASAGFPTTCEACHKTTDVGWRNGGSGFNHSQFFTLVGTHQLQTCATCHKNNVYKGTPRDCAGCHLPLYQQTTRPNHAQSGFPTTCENCHRPTDANWNNGSFNHTSVFALVGTHATVECVACHKNNVTKGTPRDCVGCHRADYDRTTAPNHAQAGLPTTCENCHRASDTSWRNANFNHNSVFALVGRHAAAQCATCHVNGVFKGTPRDCVGCHRTQYDRTTAPNHAQAGFSTQCDSCHRATDSQWTGVTFNHNQFFALQGVHAQQQCATCHVNGVYKGTPRTCVGCHQTAYNNTRNPNHAQSGFPTTCDSCHRATDTSWTQGRFTHTRFPLSGKHNVPCAQCHTSPPPAFNCLNCHTRAKTDDQHKGRSGYRYDSAACYACHPNGRAD